MNQNISEQEFFELAKNRNRYKVKKRLTGELAYAAVGDIFHSDTLYDRGYNINQLLIDGFLELVPRIFAFEKIIVGKNLHTVFTVCPQCSNHGVNTPLEKTCGNCGYTETRTYYDAETIDRFISEQGQREGGLSGIEKLLSLLAQYGGEIVSTAKLSPEWVAQARASGRMYVDENSLGYVWEPDIKGFPTTDEAVAEFERWFPLTVPLPGELNNPDFLFKKLKEKKSTPTEDLKEQGQAAGVWQLCPKCNGQGRVSRPPGLPSDIQSWSGTQMDYECDICNGAKIIAPKHYDL